MRDIAFQVPVVTTPASLNGDLSVQVATPIAPLFHAYNYRVAVRIAGEPARYAQFRKQMAKFGGTANLGVGACLYDQVVLLKWAIERAQKQSGNFSTDSVKKVLDSLSQPGSGVPTEKLMVYKNPTYSASEHSAINADYATFWGQINVSKPIDGAYEGIPIVMKSA
jgi:hypothetical protein